MLGFGLRFAPVVQGLCGWVLATARGNYNNTALSQHPPHRIRQGNKWKPLLIDISELRHRLQAITDTAAQQGMSFDELEQMIAGLASTHPHAIRRLSDEARGYRCFVHALELVGSRKYQLIAGADADAGRETFFAGSEFARFVVESGTLVQISGDEALPGEAVIYFDDQGVPKHAGKIVSEEKRIKSKWGGGLFLEHGLWEVPESYGNAVRFYRRLRAEKAEETFLEFGRSQDDFDDFVDAFDLKDLFEQPEANIRDQEYLNKLAEHAKDTSRLFSNLMKPEREGMVCRTFLRCLGVAFDEGELISQPGEPIDVGFRDTRFQIIEVLEEGRRRSDEWRERERKYREARLMDDVLEPYREAVPVSLGEIVQLLSERLEDKGKKYAGEDIDVLAYVNFGDEYLDPNSAWPDVQPVQQYGWRSVSFVFPPYSVVLHARAAAPDFLRSTVGQLVNKCNDPDRWFDE